MYKDLKEDYVKMPESFHKRIENTLESLDTKQSKSIRFPKAAKIILVAAIIMAVLSVSTFAVDGVVKWIEKRNYMVTLSLEDWTTGESVKDAEYVDLQFDYMPGYVAKYDPPHKMLTVPRDDGSYGYGFGFTLYKDDLAKDMKFDFVGSVEELKFGTHDAAVIRFKLRNGDEFIDNMRQFLIHFEDYGYILLGSLSEEISDEEMLKVAEGISLVETDKEHAFIPSEDIPGIDIGEPVASQQLPDKTVEKKAIGDTFTVQHEKFNVTATGVHILDNISALDKSSFLSEYINCEVNDYHSPDVIADENGNLKQHERKTWTLGDGINSIDEITEVKTVGRKLICVDLKVKNNTGAEADFYAYSYMYDNEDIEKSASFDLIYMSYPGEQRDCFYDFYSPAFSAGEEKVITLGFLVDDDADFSQLSLEFDVSTYENMEHYIQIDLSK